MAKKLPIDKKAKKLRKRARLLAFRKNMMQSMAFRGDAVGFPWYGYTGAKLPFKEWIVSKAPLVALDRGNKSFISMEYVMKE